MPHPTVEASPIFQAPFIPTMISWVLTCPQSKKNISSSVQVPLRDPIVVFNSVGETVHDFLNRVADISPFENWTPHVRAGRKVPEAVLAALHSANPAPLDETKNEPVASVPRRLTTPLDMTAPEVGYPSTTFVSMHGHSPVVRASSSSTATTDQPPGFASSPSTQRVRAQAFPMPRVRVEEEPGTPSKSLPENDLNPLSPAGARGSLVGERRSRVGKQGALVRERGSLGTQPTRKQKSRVRDGIIGILASLGIAASSFSITAGVMLTTNLALPSFLMTLGLVGGTLALAGIVGGGLFIIGALITLAVCLCVKKESAPEAKRVMPQSTEGKSTLPSLTPDDPGFTESPVRRRQVRASVGARSEAHRTVFHKQSLRVWP